MGDGRKKSILTLLGYSKSGEKGFEGAVVVWVLSPELGILIGWYEDGRRRVRGGRDW